MPLCLLEDIRKSFSVAGSEIEILKGISLSIDEGEFVAIMGASGSGKTTLMNILGCLDTPTSGRYFFSGKEVSGLSDNELSEIRNEAIGFVFQSFYLIPYATVLENVLLPTVYFSGSIDGIRQKAMDILRLMGLEDRARFKPNQLSGGQQQRVAIARALINSPKLILADEPTGELDSKTSKEIMEIFKEMNLLGHTIVIITHDTNIASYAKRVIHIKDGKLVDGAYS